MRQVLVAWECAPPWGPNPNKQLGTKAQRHEGDTQDRLEEMGNGDSEDQTWRMDKEGHPGGRQEGAAKVKLGGGN